LFHISLCNVLRTIHVMHIMYLHTDANTFTLKTEAVWTSEVLIFYNTAWHHNPEDLNLNLDQCRNLKSHMRKN